MRPRKLLVVVCSLLLLLTTASTAFGYTLNGGKWGSYTINYKDHTGMGYASSAANNWTYPSGLSNKIYVVSGSAAGPDVYTTNDSGVPWDGMTYVSISGGYFNWANIYDNLYYTNTFDTAKHQGVMTHEFGHALGLGERTGPAQAVMYQFSDQRFYTTVQADDNNGIKYLYP